MDVPTVANPRCPVCRATLADVVDVCCDCETAHHPDCFAFTGQCAVFACGGTRALRHVTGTTPHSPVEIEVQFEPFVDEPPARLSRVDALCRVTPVVAPLARIERPAKPNVPDGVMIVGVGHVIGAILTTIPALGCTVMGVGFLCRDTFLLGLGLAGLVRAQLGLADRLFAGDLGARQEHLILCVLLAVLGLSSRWIVVLAVVMALPLVGVSFEDVR